MAKPRTQLLAQHLQLLYDTNDVTQLPEVMWEKLLTEKAIMISVAALPGLLLVNGYMRAEIRKLPSKIEDKPKTVESLRKYIQEEHGNKLTVLVQVTNQLKTEQNNDVIQFYKELYKGQPDIEQHLAHIYDNALNSAELGSIIGELTISSEGVTLLHSASELPAKDKQVVKEIRHLGTTFGYEKPIMLMLPMRIQAYKKPISMMKPQGRTSPIIITTSTPPKPYSDDLKTYTIGTEAIPATKKAGLNSIFRTKQPLPDKVSRKLVKQKFSQSSKDSKVTPSLFKTFPSEQEIHLCTVEEAQNFPDAESSEEWQVVTPKNKGKQKKKDQPAPSHQKTENSDESLEGSALDNYLEEVYSKHSKKLNNIHKIYEVPTSKIVKRRKVVIEDNSSDDNSDKQDSDPQDKETVLPEVVHMLNSITSAPSTSKKPTLERILNENESEIEGSQCGEGSEPDEAKKQHAEQPAKKENRTGKSNTKNTPKKTMPSINTFIPVQVEPCHFINVAQNNHLSCDSWPLGLQYFTTLAPIGLQMELEVEIDHLINAAMSGEQWIQSSYDAKAAYSTIQCGRYKFIPGINGGHIDFSTPIIPIPNSIDALLNVMCRRGIWVQGTALPNLVTITIMAPGQCRPVHTENTKLFEHMVAIYSMKSKQNFWIGPKGSLRCRRSTAPGRPSLFESTEEAIILPLDNNSMLVMDKEARYVWEHCVPTVGTIYVTITFKVVKDNLRFDHPAYYQPY